MKTIPKISVVTVTYNCVDVLENTLESVINQKYSNVEYIVIDGKSNDGTLHLINKHKDHISILVSEPDKGIFDAMNKAINLATGDWILFMNAGDTFADDNVLTNVFSNHIESNVGVVLVMHISKESQDFRYTVVSLFIEIRINTKVWESVISLSL